MTPRSTQLDKPAVLSGLFAVWEDIDRLLAGLPETRWRAPTALPGWTVHAVVAHLIGSELTLLGHAVPDADIDMAALPHVRNEMGAFNERWVRHLSAESGAHLRARFREVTDDRRRQLIAMSDDDWNAPAQTPAGVDTYGRFMRIRTFDCWMHEHDIRDAVGAPASEDDLRGPGARLALDEIAASMGYVVGKLGGAPDGSRVVFELTGPLARRIHVAVAGRGRVVDDFGGQEPTVTIRLDGLLFTRLVGGRAPSSAGIELGGDEDLAARIVEHLNYVI
ncbi:maleylpyruvate isomerase family mycothiol-dependent enzyme [Mycobacterium sp. SM1]|uniref:maleylpyruvate isomerase family mycothiol-dependent enzyme n=1 Tax=Mycobacterium sp. SM1 TaxID=2816243 RepID=UPI001BCBCDD7|nr:maleylpyruvate isomerase family mycothiol-dependent enzyme [Mycobacterium sp. SM1]MBS4727044.1 maleylpyruvate isomerase family mycothiol-dependent enzyme [Mycobacterium sp. SM1]